MKNVAPHGLPDGPMFPVWAETNMSSDLRGLLSLSREHASKDLDSAPFCLSPRMTTKGPQEWVGIPKGLLWRICGWGMLIHTPCGHRVGHIWWGNQMCIEKGHGSSQAWWCKPVMAAWGWGRSTVDLMKAWAAGPCLHGEGVGVRPKSRWIGQKHAGDCFKQWGLTSLLDAVWTANLLAQLKLTILCSRCDYFQFRSLKLI